MAELTRNLWGVAIDSTKGASDGVYTWVPQQTWDRTWTDEELYAKYGITEEEQAYIAERIREMAT